MEQPDCQNPQLMWKSQTQVPALNWTEDEFEHDFQVEWPNHTFQGLSLSFSDWKLCPGHS